MIIKAAATCSAFGLISTPMHTGKRCSRHQWGITAVDEAAVR